MLNLVYLQNMGMLINQEKPSAAPQTCLTGYSNCFRYLYQIPLSLQLNLIPPIS